MHYFDWMLHKVWFVCLLDIFIFLPEVIGTKITQRRGKLNKEAKYLKGDLYKTKNESYRKMNQTTNKFKTLTSQLNKVLTTLSMTNVVFAEAFALTKELS